MEQLRVLKDLFDNSFMTKDEYDQRRQQIIDKITSTHIPETKTPTQFPHAKNGRLLFPRQIFVVFL